MNNRVSTDSFVNNVNTSLVELGFELDVNGTDEYVFAKWVRPVRWATDFFEFVALSMLIETKDRIEVNAKIGIESPILTEVENSCELYTCGLGAMDKGSLPWAGAMPLLSVPLHWLVVNSGKRKGRWLAASTTEPTEEQEFLQDLNEHGFSFLESIAEIDCLEKFILNLDAYPTTIKAQGFYSPDVVNYVAVTLNHIGYSDRAERILLAALAGELPSSERRWIDKYPAYADTLKCRIQKVARYLGVQWESEPS